MKSIPALLPNSASFISQSQEPSLATIALRFKKAEGISVFQVLLPTPGIFASTQSGPSRLNFRRVRAWCGESQEVTLLSLTASRLKYTTSFCTSLALKFRLSAPTAVEQSDMDDCYEAMKSDRNSRWSSASRTMNGICRRNLSGCAGGPTTPLSESSMSMRIFFIKASGPALERFLRRTGIG